MKKELLEILVCPRCLGNLELKDEILEKGEIIRGRLCCERCKLDFLIEDGVVVFGIRAEDKIERESEMDGENEWVFSANEIQVHVDFAKTSSQIGEKIIRKLKKRIKKEQIGKKLRVLDVGAGWGGFQSWQFSKHGFEVVATELCPEFLFATDCVTKDAFFERVVTDCTLLPFRNNSFDIIFCKELVHHVMNPMDLLNEMRRVASPNALIVIREPCISIVRSREKAKKEDIAMKVGITHHYYTYNEYVAYMKRIASDIEIDGETPIINSSNHPILSKIQKLIVWLGKVPVPTLRRFILKVQLIFIGGSLEIIGVKSSEKGKEGHNRDVISIDLKRLQLNVGQVEFYRKELIPAILKVFSQTYERYK